MFEKLQYFGGRVVFGGSLVNSKPTIGEDIKFLNNKHDKICLK